MTRLEMNEQELRTMKKFFDSIEDVLEEMAIDNKLSARLEQEFMDARLVVQDKISGWCCDY